MLDYIKKFIKKHYILLIIALVISLPLTIIGTVRTNKALTLTGDLTDISSFVKIENENITSGSISSIYVKYYEKSTVLQNLLSKFDYSSKLETLDNNEIHLSDYENYQAGVIQKNSSIMTSIINAYNEVKKVDDSINIEYSYNGEMVTYYSPDSAFRIGDKIIKVNDVEYSIGDVDFRNEIRNSLKNDLKDTYTVIRDGVYVKIYENEFGSIGIYSYYNISYDKLTPKITVSKTYTVGPSAGFLQSLAVYNKLTKEDITKNKKIAGTGTIDIYGNVGKIGGITQKIYTAFSKNVDIFFCPSANYEEALVAYNMIPGKERMALIEIKTFDEAISYLKNI